MGGNLRKTARRDFGNVVVLRFQNCNIEYRKVGHSERYNVFSDTPGRLIIYQISQAITAFFPVAWDS